MKFDINDFINDAFAAGKTPDEVAQSFTDAINAAVRKRQEEEAAKKRVAEAVAQRKERLRALLLAAYDFAHTYYPRLVEGMTPEEVSTKTVDQLDGAMEQAYNEMPWGDIDNLFATCFPESAASAPKAEKKPAAKDSVASIDDEIKALLKALGIEE